MNVVPIRSTLTGGRSQMATDIHVARVDVFNTMAAAEPHWRVLEHGDSLATPYQRYDFLKLWQRHVGTDTGISPFIVVGFNATRQPLFLWPLGARHVGSLVGLEFLGGKHANFNMGIWRRDVACSIDVKALRAVLTQLAGRVDFISLISQPLTWGGATNPFALLPHQRAANHGFSGALVPDFDALLRARTNSDTRKKLRKKERGLASFGEVRFERATAPDNVRRMLDAFFKQKTARMRGLGLPDIFSDAGVRRFIEAGAIELQADGKPLIELYALSVDDIIVATLGGIAGGGRFCAMFNSMIQGRFAAESPGEQILLRVARDCCERGFTTLDLGIGEARYKSILCEDPEPLFDSYLALSPAGRMFVFALSAGAVIKRTIKQSPALWPMAQAVRRLRARLSSAP